MARITAASVIGSGDGSVVGAIGSFLFVGVDVVGGAVEVGVGVAVGTIFAISFSLVMACSIVIIGVASGSGCGSVFVGIIHIVVGVIGIIHVGVVSALSLIHI